MATMQIEGTEFLQTTEAAEALGLSVESINKAVQRGNLKPRKLGIYNLFSRDEIERYRAEHKGRIFGREQNRK